MSDNGHSPTDIITYIGVPLAVLGVLPILYNTFATLVNASKIKRALRHSRLTALTRSDVINRVIEIELPRYAVTPWDRFAHEREYWSLSHNPSAIPGGSWTTFNWKTRTVGIKTQRVEYADQLRQPQVDVAFDELVCYLLDLGAVPDPHGWRLLRSTGLWTPVGCALLRAPAGAMRPAEDLGDDLRDDLPGLQGLEEGHRGRDVLTVAPLDDSDGSLSLSVYWHPEWTTRSASDLPPYWVSLLPGTDVEWMGMDPEDAREPEIETETETETEKETEKETEIGTKRPPSQTSASELPLLTITCQISMDGIIQALTQEMPHGRSVSADHHLSLSIEHLRVRSSRSLDGVWFASAATAYGTTSQTVLWNYRIPDDVLAFARRDTVPCGVLVLLSFVDESETPEWATKHTEDMSRRLSHFSNRHAERRAAEIAEARLPPEQRVQAARDRWLRESAQNMADFQESNRVARERKKQREMEALQSPKWDAQRVAELGIVWLQRQHQQRQQRLRLRERERELERKKREREKERALAASKEQSESQSESQSEPEPEPQLEPLPEPEPLPFLLLQTPAQKQQYIRQTAGVLLHRMVHDAVFSARLCGILDRWKAWFDIGGMKAADLEVLRQDTTTFALATLLVALIQDTSSLDGTLALDLQECLRLWRKVRLG